MLTPAVAVWAMTLSAGLPDSVVTANVVRAIAARLRPHRGQGAGERRAEPAGVRHQRPQRERRVRCQPAEQLDGRCRDAGRHRGAVEPGDRPGQPRGRSHPGRGRRVAAAALDPQLDRHDALLGHADDADRLADAGEGVVRDRAALVDDEPRPDAAACELLDRLLGRRTEHLLVAAEREPDVLGRREVALEQGLDRLADPDQAALVVEGAAAPDLAVDDRAAERRRAARSPSTGTTSRWAISTTGRVGARAGPVEEQAVGVHPGQLEPLVQQRELPRELGDELVERRGVDAARARGGRRSGSGPAPGASATARGSSWRPPAPSSGG